MARAKPIRKLSARTPLFSGAESILQTRLEEMLAYETYLGGPDNVYELHQMRIAAKRLRYTMELFLPLYSVHSPFGAEFAEAITEIETLQKHLGEIHDADVLVPQLTAQLAALLDGGYGRDARGEPLAGVHHVDFDAAQGLLTLCSETRERRSRRYAQLTQAWETLQAGGFFERLRSLLRAAAGENSLCVVSDGAPAEAVREEPAGRGDPAGAPVGPAAALRCPRPRGNRAHHADR